MHRLLAFIILLSTCIISSSFKPPFYFNKLNITPDTYSLLITKHKYELKLLNASGEVIAKYPVVFGNNEQGDKMMQGDHRTPEGVFHISYKRKHEKWRRFMLIDYPNEESYRKFKARKAAGLIPPDAKIGGDIGIHGTWPNEDFAIDRKQNWTEGCISTKNKFVEELFSMLPIGTKVEIIR